MNFGARLAEGEAYEAVHGQGSLRKPDHPLNIRMDAMMKAAGKSWASQLRKLARSARPVTTRCVGGGLEEARLPVAG